MRKLCFLLLFGLASGCSMEHYKRDADKEAYEILENKWQESFGTRANVRISDVEAGADDIDIKDYDLSEPISLADSLAIATANSREYQGQRERLYLSALSLSLERHNFTPRFFGIISAGYNHNRSDESVDASSRFGFTQRLADGTEIAASLTNNWTEYLTGSSRGSLGSVIAASISRPLLRGAGRKIAQENLTQAERNTIYAMRNFARYRQTFAVGIIADYYRVLQQQDRVENQRRNYERLKVIEDQVTLQGEVGTVPRFQVGQAQQRTLSARDAYIDAQRQADLALDRFRIRLAVPIGQPLLLNADELSALESKGIEELALTIEQAVEIALENRLDLQTAYDSVEDARRQLAITEDNLGIRLDFRASANVRSDGQKDPGNFQFSDGNYSLGLETDLDLDRKSERNAYRRALINFTQQQRDYELKIDQIKQEINTSWGNLVQARQSYAIQQMSLEIAQQRVDGDNILFQEGRTTIRDLLDSQDALLSAQNSTINAIINYTLAMLNLYSDIGLLVIDDDGNVEAETVTIAINNGRELEN